MNGATRAVNLKEPELCILNILKWFNLVFKFCVLRRLEFGLVLCVLVFSNLSVPPWLCWVGGGGGSLDSLVWFLLMEAVGKKSWSTTSLSRDYTLHFSAMMGYCLSRVSHIFVKNIFNGAFLDEKFWSNLYIGSFPFQFQLTLLYYAHNWEVKFHRYVYLGT